MQAQQAQEAAERGEPAIHPERGKGNISKHVELEFGDVEAALERALEDRDWQVRQAAEDLLGPGTTGDRP